MKNSFLLFAFAVFLASCSSNKQATAYVEDDIYWTATENTSLNDYSSFTEVQEEPEYYNEGEAKSLEEGTVVNNYYGDSYYGNSYSNRRFRRFHAIYGYTYYNPYSYWSYSPYNYNPWRPSGFYISYGYNPWAWGGYAYNPYVWNSGYAYYNPYGYGYSYYNGNGWGNNYYGGNGYYNGCPGYGGGYYSTGNDNGSGSYGFFGGRTSVSSVSNGAVTDGASEGNGANSNISNNLNERQNISNSKIETPAVTTKPITRVERPLISNTRPLSLPVENKSARPSNTSSANPQKIQNTRNILPSNARDINRPATNVYNQNSSKTDKTTGNGNFKKESRNSNRGVINRSNTRSSDVQRSGNSRSIRTTRTPSPSSSGTRSSGSSRGGRK